MSLDIIVSKSSVTHRCHWLLESDYHLSYDRESKEIIIPREPTHALKLNSKIISVVSNLFHSFKGMFISKFLYKRPKIRDFSFISLSLTFTSSKFYLIL